VPRHAFSAAAARLDLGSLWRGRARPAGGAGAVPRVGERRGGVRARPPGGEGGPLRDAGYVIHEPPPKASQQILIGIGPFFVNSILGALIALPAVIPVLRFEAGTPLDYFLIWLGVSIAMHAFPSTGDAKSIWRAVQSGKMPGAARFVATPVVGLIYLCAVGSMFWLDLIYGMALAMLFPNLLVSLLA
jgi:hypothetical protein